MKPRLLAIVPDPDGAFAQAGGVLSATRAVLGPEIRAAFDVRIVDTTMRAFPRPDRRERVIAGARRGAAAVRLIAAHRPQVAITFCGDRASFYEKSSLLLLAKAAGARAFLSARSGHARSWLEESAAGRRWVAAVGRAIDGFLVQSEGWRDFYAWAGVPREKLHVWHNSTDTAAFAPIAAARRAWSPERPFRYLFLGWTVADKGLPELCATAERLAARPGPAFRLAVAGGGAVGEELRARQARSALPPFIELLGWVKGEARDRELRAADALILPTHVEGFPNVLLEAMASALPVIATPVGAIPDVVVPEETGLLVPPRDEAALLEAMDRLRQRPDEAAAMGRRGLERARSRFDRAIGVARLLSILRGEGAGDVNVREAPRSQAASE